MTQEDNIRQAIATYLDWLAGKKDCAPRGEFTIKDMLSWLDCQKGQEPAERSEEYADMPDLHSTGVPIDMSVRWLYRVSTRGAGDIYVVARSFDEAANYCARRLDEARYGSSIDRCVEGIQRVASENFYFNTGEQIFSEAMPALITGRGLNSENI